MMLPSVCAATLRRLHREAGVDRGPEIVDLDLAGRAIDRHLGDPCRQGVVLHHGADAETAAVARPLPVGHLGHRAQQRLHPRLSLGKREPERDRIEAPVLGDLVEEALRREGVVSIADAAKRGEPRAARLDDVLGELVGDRILRDRRALHDDAVGPRRRWGRRAPDV